MKRKVDPGEPIGVAGANEILARMRKRMQECLQSSPPDDLDDPDDPADHDSDGVPLRFWLH
jgi:hypothetical protein